MKKFIALFLIFSFISPLAFAGMVRGYFRKDGTYVAPHYRCKTSPYSTRTKVYKTIYSKQNTPNYTRKRSRNSQNSCDF